MIMLNLRESQAHHAYRLLVIVALVLMTLTASNASAADDNDAYRAAILSLIAAHNVAYPPSLVPGPNSTVFGGVTYGTNLALKFVPPYLVEPSDLGFNPNFTIGGDVCARQLYIPRNQADYSNFLGINPQFPSATSDWGALGVPYLEHANTDATLKVFKSGQLLETGDQLFDIGTHTLLWEAETLISYPLDVALPVVLMYLTSLKELPAGKEFILNVLLEAGLISLDQFVVNSTPHEVFPILNRQVQRIQIYDRDAPQITLSQNTVHIEALSPGGLSGDFALNAIEPTVSTYDRCNQPVSVFENLPNFLPLGTHTVTWTALDAGPNPDSPRSDKRNETTITQTIVIEDTTPPLLIPPADIVVESVGVATVQLGQPLVFDVVDLEPTLSCEVDQDPIDCLAPFNAPVGLTEITWTATDGSGQSAQGMQLVNVKLPGTNNTPVAHDQILAIPVKSFDSIDIELTAEDMDGDRLAFALVDQPENGFFIAPLYPYFIEDYRIEAGANPLTLEQRCDELAGQSGPSNFELEYPYFSRWVSVTDEGLSYVYDEGHMDCQQHFLNGGGPSSDLRIAVFDQQGELINAQFFGSDTEANDVWVDPNTSQVYMVYGTIDSTNSILQYSPELEFEYFYNMQYAEGPGFNQDFIEEIQSVVVDANGLLYAATRYNISVFKIEGVTPQSNGTTVHPEYLGSLPNPNFDLGYDSLAIGPNGSIYVSDSDADRIYRYSPSALDGNGTFTIGQFDGWLGKCTSDNNPGLETHCDVANQRSVGFSCTDQTCGVSGFNWGVEPGQFRNPKGIDVDPNGVLYVTDFDNNRVQRFTPEGYVAGIAKSNCSSNCFVLGDFGKPSDISVNSDHFFILDRQTQLLHVSETTPIKEVRDTSVIVEYSSNNNFVGTDSFTFEVTDGLRQDGVFVTSNLATVTIPVVRNDRMPIADAGIAATTNEDVPVVITLDGNDPDFPLDTIEFQISSPPQFGTLSGQGANRTYTPNQDYAGEDSFSFVLFDGTNTSEPESVAITIAPLNDPPVIDPDAMNLFGLGYIGTIVVPFTDPDDEDKHRVSIDWGDGSAVQLEGQAQPDGSLSGPLLQEGRGDSGAVIAEHLYDSVGSYQIQVCITDRVEVDESGTKTDTPESTTTCSTSSINVEQRPLVLVDIDPGNCVIDPDDPVDVPFCSTADGNDINYTLSIKNIMPEAAGGLDANNLVLTANVDPGLVITGFEEAVARVMPGYGTDTDSAVTNRFSGEPVNAMAECGWLQHVVTCTVDNLPSGSEVLIFLNTSSSGMATSDRNVRLSVELTMDEPNLATVSKNAKDVLVTLSPFGDADGDGVVNSEDAFPNDPNESADSDGDGIGNIADIDDDNDSMPDVWEARYGLNELVNDGALDSDGDGLLNAEEYAAGTDPTRSDTDTDGVLDGVDSCPARFDKNQYDSDFDGLGDVCDLNMTARALATVDVTGDSQGDYAILRGSRLGSRLWIGSASGVWKHRVQVLTPDLTARDMAPVENVDGSGGAAIAVLSDDNFGNTRVSLVNPQSGALIQEVMFFDPAWRAQAVTAVEGAGNNGQSALAVLAENEDGGLRVELRNANDGSFLETIDVLAQGWRPIDISALADGTVAVLAIADSGQAAVVTSNPAGELSEISFLDPDSTATALATIPATGPQAARIVVLASDHSGGAVLEVRDADSGVLVNQTTFALSAPIDVTSIDQGDAKLALLLVDPQSGALTMSQLDQSGVEVSSDPDVLDSLFAPRAVVGGHSDRIGILGSDDRGVLSLELHSTIDETPLSLLTTSTPSNISTLQFENEVFVLSTGAVSMCDPFEGCSGGDFQIAENSSRDNPVVLFQRWPNEIAFLDGVPFDDVNYALVAQMSFTSSLIDEPFDYNDTVVIRLANGDLYKIGHPQCFYDDIGIHTVCVQLNGANDVEFDWAQLIPDDDGDGIDNTLDNCVNVANPSQLDADGDGYGNACDADLNNDCTVNFVDVSVMTDVFFCSDSTQECQNADLDGSGAVNFLDYVQLTSAFLQTPGPSAQQDLCTLPLVVNQPISMRGTFQYDLDTGAESTMPGQTQMDIFYRRMTSVSGFITPINGANLAFMGGTRPTAEQCLEVEMTLEGIPLSSLGVGDWICVRTNDGRMSRFEIKGANVLPINTASRIDIELATWECESCEQRFDPGPINGLIGWFDADYADSLQLESGSVIQWDDRSGTVESMASLSASQRPVFNASGMNGRGSISFDGQDDRLFSLTNTSLSSEYTIFIAARNNVRRNYNGLFSLRPTNNGPQAGLEVYWQGGTSTAASGNLVVAANRLQSGFSYISTDNAGPAAGEPYTMAVRVSELEGISQLYVDGSNQFAALTGSDLTSNQSLPMCIGQGFGPNLNSTTLNGDIGEVLIFDRYLTNQEFDFVSSYMEDKWSGQ